MATIQIADDLLHQTKAIAESAGYSTPDLLVEEAIRLKCGFLLDSAMKLDVA